MTNENDEQNYLVLDDIGEFVRSHTTREITQNKSTLFFKLFFNLIFRYF